MDGEIIMMALQSSQYVRTVRLAEDMLRVDCADLQEPYSVEGFLDEADSWKMTRSFSLSAPVCERPSTLA